MSILVQIPFSGFYESVHNDELNFAVESIAESKEVDVMEYDDSVNWSKTFENVAKDYAKVWLDLSNISGSFHELKSPKFYNFETDKIICNIDKECLESLKSKIDLDEFDEWVKENYSTRSGFISFVNTDTNSWDQWDGLEYTLLLEYIDQNNDDLDLLANEDKIVEYMRGNGYYENTIVDNWED